MNYVDLFAGAGGLSLGFEKAGFKNVFAIEYDKKAAETYCSNFPSNKIMIKDIKDVSDDEITRYTNRSSIDVVIGGPPCQGFSLAGRIGRSFIEDERNLLFKEFLRVVSIIKPKMFVMENVARMKSHNNGNTINEIKESFEKIGYNVQYQVLQASNYNVPQKRQRLFIVGTTTTFKTFQFPEPNKKEVTVKEAIEDLPKLGNNDTSDIPNHFSMNHSSQMLEKMSYVIDGGDRNDIPEEIRPKTGDIRKYVRYSSKKPSFTITGDMRKVFHYEQNRALSPRELARLQSFPDNFIFKGNSISIQQQIGNAVPPNLSYAVAKEIKKSLERSI